MDFKPNISKIKHRLLLFMSVMFIAIILQPKQEVYASEVNWAGMAAYINSTYSNNTVGTDTITNGVSKNRTGYLAYMVNKETGAPTSDAIAFAAGTDWIAGSQWIVESRHGGLTGSPRMKEAEWGQPWIPPEHKGDPLTSLEPNIKEWFRTKGSAFVDEYFPANHSNFVADTEVLVLETIMNCQFSKKGSITEIDARKEAFRQINCLGKREFCRLAAEHGFSDLYMHCILEERHLFDSQTFEGEYDYAREQVARELEKIIMDEGGDSAERHMFGDPVIGTVPNLLKYDQWNTTVFDSYLNDGAPHAEKIEYSEAGFEAYSGSGTLSDAQVQQYGVAMMIIHCKDPAQTTCDEPLIPSPHDPPKESDGKITIVKSYREKINGEEKHVATTSRSNLGTQIIIENEQTYQVVGWKTSTTTNTNISSLSWESSVPSSIIQQGTAPKSVTLQPTETCLYVLLEKVEEEPPEEEDYNYLLSESSITRTVWFSNPDHNKLGNMNNPEWIYDHKFNWASPATPYCEGHEMKGACQGNHVIDCDEAGCTVGCPSSCKDPHHDGCEPGCMKQHEHEKCTTTHTKYCDTPDDCDLNISYPKCTGTPEWIDQQLSLTITNTLQNKFPDILATKEGWNAESKKGDIVKRFYGNGPIDRTTHGPEEHKEESEITNWDYVCILMRGKDKLTLAEWENDGDGNNAGNNANAYLKDASSSGFTVANTDSGTRKTTDYYETFNTHFNRDEAEGDIATRGMFTVVPKDLPEGTDLISQTCRPEVKSYVSPLSINGVTVKVETYSGTASEHKNDTSIVEGHLDYDLSGFNRSSGRMVKSSNVNGTITFTPYIEMKYDILPVYNLQAFVLSEFTKMSTTQKQNNM